MPNVISEMLGRYEQGQVRRRDLIAALTALTAASRATATPASTFQGVEVNHVALNVTDVKRSRDFYQKHLGLPVVNESESSCFLGLGKGNFLALFRSSTPGLNHYCIGIDSYNVERVTATLERQNLSPSRRQNRVYFKDPDGIEVQLSAPGHQP